MLQVHSIRVAFDGVPALDGASLEIGGDEVLALLGPSGSGKSTLLRVIAGLQLPQSGRVMWRGHDLSGVAVHRRRFGLMFQSAALFPHLSVTQNVGFGLEMAGLPPAEIEVKVNDALAWVGLEGFGSRSTEGLSGGEQQRVALARTLAPEPELVMLDEPLGSLDRNLRERLAGDIRGILSDRRVPALVVTHDRDEAAVMADRIALMREGRIVQTGTLNELVTDPADDWVAGFLK